MIIGCCRFFTKVLVPMSQFSDHEKHRLSRVFLDDAVAKYFGWKRYLTNDEIIINEEVAIISWDNYYKGTGSLEEARAQAEAEKLDLVLVCKKPATVRIMNYKNWILRWAYRDSKTESINLNKRSAPVYNISHKISDIDLDIKLNRIADLLEKHDSVIIDSRIKNQNSFEEVKNLKIFEGKVQKLLRGLLFGKAIDMKVTSSDFSFKIMVKKFGSSKSAVNLSMELNEPKDERVFNKKVFNRDFGDEEEEYMQAILTGNHNKFDSVKEDMEVLEDLERFNRQDYNEDQVHNQSTHEVDDKTIELRERVVSLVGEALASKFLKGRLKFK
jgi:translation initiation factor IF-3